MTWNKLKSPVVKCWKGSPFFVDLLEGTRSTTSKITKTKYFVIFSNRKHQGWQQLWIAFDLDVECIVDVTCLSRHNHPFFSFLVPFVKFYVMARTVSSSCKILVVSQTMPNPKLRQSLVDPDFTYLDREDVFGWLVAASQKPLISLQNVCHIVVLVDLLAPSSHDGTLNRLVSDGGSPPL